MFTVIFRHFEGIIVVVFKKRLPVGENQVKLCSRVVFLFVCLQNKRVLTASVSRHHTETHNVEVCCDEVTSSPSL